MATKYVKITAGVGKVKVAPGSVVANSQNPGITAPLPAQPKVSAPEVKSDVNVAVTGMPGDGRPPMEPLFRFNSDKFVVDVQMGLHLMRPLFDAIHSVDAVQRLAINTVKQELVDATDDFNGQASIEDDQYAVFTKVTTDATFTFEYFGVTTGKPFTEGVAAAHNVPLMTFNKGVADYLGDFVEHRVMVIDKGLLDTGVAIDAPALHPSKGFHDVVNEVDSVAVHPEKVAEEQSTVADTTPLLGFGKNPIEVIAFVEQLAKVVSVVYNDGADASDTLTKAAGKVANDNIQASDGGFITTADYVEGSYFAEDYCGQTYFF